MEEAGLAAGKSIAAVCNGWIVFENEVGQLMTPPRARTWGHVGRPPVGRFHSRDSGRLSVTGMCCFKPGSRASLIYGLRESRGPGTSQRASSGRTSAASWPRPESSSAARLCWSGDNGRLCLTRGLREFIEKNAD